jgi:hypothetical protein
MSKEESDTRENEDIEAGSNVPNEATSGSPSPVRWWHQSKFQRCGGLALCLIVVGVTVGVAVGVSGGSVDRDEQIMPQALSSSLSLVPSTAPSPSNAPSTSTTPSPSTAPSTSPLMSAFLSTAPTETPNNEFCDEAFDVTGDDMPIGESLQNTTVRKRVTCSSGDEIEQRGRWYEYSGNGLGLTVEMMSAPEDETLLEIFMGTCEELECTEAVATSNVGNNATVNFIAAENTTYLIHVFSTLDAMSEPSADYSLQVSDNGGCVNAFPINNNQALFSGSTAAAAVRDIAPPSCGSATVGVSPGVWFEVAGDGMNIEASTCGGASFDTQISVYAGGCGSLECVTGNDNSCGSQSSVIWLTEVRLTSGYSL